MQITLCKISLAAALCCLFAGCGCGRGGQAKTGWADTLYHPRYACGFDVFSTAGAGTVVSFYDPWPGASGVRHDLFVSRGGQAPPPSFSGTVVEAPLRRVVCMSSSHVAFIDLLGEAATIKGVSGVRYIYDPDLRPAVDSGRVAEVGYDAGVDYELIASLAPDLVFLYGVSAESPVAGKLRELGVKSVHIGEFNEPSPLGRAEWLVAFGELYDARPRAEQIFDRVSRSYNEHAERAAGFERRPRVVLNAPWRDVWYMPGGGSYMARLIADAGGEYIGARDDNTYSSPVSIETAWVTASSADYWLNPGTAATLSQVVEADRRFGAIPPVTSGRVYNNTRRMSPGGGNDFWESGAVRPDLVLLDMIRILHPGEEDELFYFHKLE